MALETSRTYLPLYGFFQAWRTQGAQIGVQEYMAFLDALQAGFGFSMREEANLFTLCKLLWFNPGDSFFQFKRLFTQFYQSERQALLSMDVKETRENFSEGQIEPKPEDSTPNPEKRENEQSEADWDEKDAERLPPSDRESSMTGSSSMSTSPQGQYVKLGEGKDPDYQPGFTESQETTDAVRQQFRFTPQPFPVATNPRIVRLLLRQLFAPAGKTRSMKVDIPQTVDQMARDGGKLLKIKYQTSDILKADLLILLDIGPGMRAFHKLAYQFINLIETELDRPVEVLYFSSVLKNSFFVNRTRTEAISLAELKIKYRRSDTPILIIGEAGAANQDYDPEETIDTEVVVKKLSKMSQRIAWLNPMPEPRWEKPSRSNAWYLRARGLPMFDMTHKGIQLAISVLKGMKSVNSGRNYGE